MKNINASELANVVGGTSKANDQITQQLTSLSTSIQSLGNNNNNSGSSSMMMMAMMMAMKPHDTVVAGGGGPPMMAAPAAAPAPAVGPVVNISTRVRH